MKPHPTSSGSPQRTGASRKQHAAPGAQQPAGRAFGWMRSRKGALTFVARFAVVAWAKPMGLLLWARLRILTSIPKTAIADDPTKLADANERESQGGLTAQVENKAEKSPDQLKLSKPGVTEAELRELFSKCGEVLEVRIMMDRRTDTPKGYAFVKFKVWEEKKEIEICCARVY